MHVAVVVAHPSDDSYACALAARAGRRPSRGRAHGRGARPVPPRLSPRSRRRNAPPTTATIRSSIRRRRTTRRSSATPISRVRVPDVVERAAGDAQGLAGAGDRARRRRSSSTTHRQGPPGLTHVRRIVGISDVRLAVEHVKIVNDNGRRMLSGRCASTAGWRTSHDLARAVLDRQPPADNERRAFLDRVGHTMANVK